MVRFNNVSGAQVLSIYSKNLQQETAEDVLKLVLQLSPMLIKKYLPLDAQSQYEDSFFSVCQQILESGRFTVESTLQML